MEEKTEESDIQQEAPASESTEPAGMEGQEGMPC